MTTGLPFDDYRRLIASLPGPDREGGMAAAARLDRAGVSEGLGRVAEIAVWLSEWSARKPVSIARPLVAVFAGNHGVAAQRVSPRPVSATAAMVEHCAAGGAAVNQLCVANDAGLKVFDLALDLPTQDITRAAALDERGCAATMAFGMEAVAGGTDLMCIGDIGVGGSTVAAAMMAALHGGDGASWAGPGSGADAAMVGRKAQVIDAALAFHRGNLKDPLEILRRLGGRETAAIMGAILAARVERTPVLLDGFAAVAAAALLNAMQPGAVDHCRLAVPGREPGMRRAAEMIGMRPLVDMEMQIEAGAGAALAVGIVRAAALCLSGVRPLPA